MRNGLVAAAVLAAAAAVYLLARGPTPAAELDASDSVGIPAGGSASPPGAQPSAEAATGGGRAAGAGGRRSGLGAVAEGPGPGARPPASPGADGGDDVLEAVRDAIAEGTPRSNATLVRALDSDDEVAKVAAIDELVKRGHKAALPKLLQVDPGGDPFIAPTAILGIGKLARDADDGSRDAAVERLAKILEEERKRQGMDSPGNILVAFESLGEIRTEGAARVLERELVHPAHATAARVAIVDALEACGRRTSVPALGAFRSAFRPSAEDAFGREIEADLLVALERAVRTLSAAP